MLSPIFILKYFLTIFFVGAFSFSSVEAFYFSFATPLHKLFSLFHCHYEEIIFLLLLKKYRRGTQMYSYRSLLLLLKKEIFSGGIYLIFFFSVGWFPHRVVQLQLSQPWWRLMWNPIRTCPFVFTRLVWAMHRFICIYRDMYLDRYQCLFIFNYRA